MNAGYNIASLLLRYQGIDWRDRHYVREGRGWGRGARPRRPRALPGTSSPPAPASPPPLPSPHRRQWNCNERMNPLFAHMYDGYYPSPLEVCMRPAPGARRPRLLR